MSSAPRPPARPHTAPLPRFVGHTPIADQPCPSVSGHGTTMPPSLSAANFSCTDECMLTIHQNLATHVLYISLTQSPVVRCLFFVFLEPFLSPPHELKDNLWSTHPHVAVPIISMVTITRTSDSLAHVLPRVLPSSPPICSFGQKKLRIFCPLTVLCQKVAFRGYFS